jgi:hypothetical protein
MSVIESTVQPRSFYQLITKPLPEDMQALRIALFDLFLWFRGDMRIWTSALTNVTAGQNIAIDMEPADTSEEWEIFYGQLIDTANIDVGDRGTIFYRDEILSLMMPIENATLSLIPSIAINGIVWPSRTATQLSANEMNTGFIAKRRDNNVSWLKIRAQYIATATVGTRTVKLQAIIKRRRLI